VIIKIRQGPTEMKTASCSYRLIYIISVFFSADLLFSSQHKVGVWEIRRGKIEGWDLEGACRLLPDGLQKVEKMRSL